MQRIASLVLALTGALVLAAGPVRAQTPAQPPASEPAPEETTPPAAAAHQASELARGDPARWYVEDATEQQRLRTLRKEIAAAYEEARIACRNAPAAERAACLKEARATYQQELAAIRSPITVR